MPEAAEEVTGPVEAGYAGHVFLQTHWDRQARTECTVESHKVYMFKGRVSERGHWN